jgi:hypothetical protein
MYLIQMLRTLQIIVHIPLFALNLPANVMMMESILINTAMFDVFAHKKICSFCDLSEYFEFDLSQILEISEKMPTQI